ncbi:MAG TPA: ammonium transporter, partial [Ktedonobacterales bacterium]|nr:ammonium transporter [Ktedonobacterales bacterium]
MGHLNTGDTAFILVSAALVLLMTPGLAFFYGGLVRHQNVLTIMMQSYISMGVVTLLWVLFGFSLAYGGDHAGLIGDFRFAGLRGVGVAPSHLYAPTVPFLAFFLFQLMFAIITPALISGAFADRVSFRAYLMFLVLWSLLVYIPFVHWVWGGGFLAQWGVKDFAGGIVVHLSAGVAALASIFVVGKRRVRADEKFLPHNVPYVALGAGLLWFGWFGFNGGSALAANGVAAVAFVNTNSAAAAGMVMWLALTWWREHRPSVTGAMTGAVAGLATVTPAAGYVPPWAAIVIGLLAAIVCYAAIQFRVRRDWDDALDVWGVHGVGGALGTLLTGVFAFAAINSVNGLFAGNAHQLGVQFVGVAIAAGYAFTVTYLILKGINRLVPVRVSEEIEARGLDEFLHGEPAYQPLPMGGAEPVHVPIT